MNPQESISKIMTKDPIAVKPNYNLSKVNEIFNSHRIHHLPVVTEGRKIVGIISKEDILRLTSVRDSFSEKEFSEIKVGDIMTSDPVVLDTSDTIGLAADIILANAFHSLPVVEDAALVGIVTSHDLIQYSFKRPISTDRNTIEMTFD